MLLAARPISSAPQRRGRITQTRLYRRPAVSSCLRIASWPRRIESAALLELGTSRSDSCSCWLHTGIYKESISSPKLGLHEWQKNKKAVSGL